MQPNFFHITELIEIKSGETLLAGTNRYLTKSFKATHVGAENHNISLENKCPIAEDNGPICMVMDIFGMVSEELDKAEMGCHGLVIVLGKAHNCFSWKDEYSIQEQGSLKDKNTCLRILTSG